MLRIRQSMIFAVAALLAGATTLFAVAQARIWGTITDENGKPVAGVKLTVTLPGVESYKVEEMSAADGSYAVTILDATRTYTYKFEKEGYQAIEQSFKVPINSNEKRDVVILSLEEARRRGPAGRELSAEDKAVLVFNEGAEAAQQGDLATARAKIEEAVALDPNLGAAHTALAAMHFTDKDYAAAVAEAEKARGIDPADVKALRILAEGYHELGETEKAAAASQALAAADPKAGAMDLFNQGIREYNAGNMGKAQEIFEKALEGDPGFAKTHYMLGMCYVSSGDSAKAKQHLETFLAMAPGDADAATAKEMLSYLK